MKNPPFISVENLKIHFPVGNQILSKHKQVLKAVDGISFEVANGEILGIVGESGCGKSTLGKAITSIYPPSSGKIYFNGKDISSFNRKEKKEFSRNVQMIFQDPTESLNPRHNVREILEEPFHIHQIGLPQERNQYAKELLNKVGLPASAISKYPFEFSGGQRQRIGIARAIALNPKLIVCDEPVSALDVSIQSQVINLLLDLQKNMNLALIFITHDLSIVKHISDYVGVMYLGKIVEIASADKIYTSPKHSYTKTLLSAIPLPDPKQKEREKIIPQGEIPSPINPPKGSAFGYRINHPRYKETIDKDLRLKEIEPHHWVANDICCLNKEDFDKLNGLRE